MQFPAESGLSTLLTSLHRGAPDHVLAKPPIHVGNLDAPKGCEVYFDNRLSVQQDSLAYALRSGQ